MSRIRILPDQVANQIAAGEVVERPVAVVKELVENSLDAGATRIDVDFQRGGKSLMRVEDNGFGMTADEAMLALERHATSKILSAEDLNAIHSFGFRGEALPSIASVSRFTLRTRREDDAVGTEIFVNGGKVVHQKACGMAPGTVIEVAHLFNSVPARRKFLKTDKTESAHIVQCVRLFALAHPRVSFTLKEDGRVLFQSPACDDFIERVAEVWSRSLVAQLMPLAQTAWDGVRLRGAIMKPGHGRSSRQDIQCFVNHRPVDNRTLTYAILESYHTHMPRGRYPAVFLFVEIDAGSVDVNVHPAKREVRFRDEGQVRRAVIKALTNTLSQESPMGCAEPAAPALIREPRALPTTPAPSVKPEPPRTIPLSSLVSPSSTPKRATPAEPAVVASPNEAASEPSPVHFDWNFIGLLRKPRLIALFETPAGLVAMHCRAAHERVEYERLCGLFEHEAVVAQPLLMPVSLDLDPVCSAALEPHLVMLAQVGIVIEPFGRNYFRLEALPQWFAPGIGERFVRDLIEGLREGRIDFDGKHLSRERLALLAATRALRVDDQPNEASIRALAKQLVACKQPMSCPRGRPVMVEYSISELSKKFGLSSGDSFFRK